ncbi:hypothetical protein FE257_006667 [Aspergillus nanangensis]|uniref:Cytochrome P450 n=1 Tax=Aspergillus nanangensis TaxID=2582783 RepID=A0AAD4CPB0_ASPNN|nr:hypothetical protein FE257_006667 [Aspergillus nanangensis]
MPIPDKTHIRINAVAIHCDPTVWGPDALTWRPSRWLSPTTIGMERRLLAWSDGPRVCPGRSFSRTEILAVIMQLFRSHRVEIAPHGGERLVDAKERALAKIAHSVVHLTLQIKHPDSTHLLWNPRV